MMDLALLLLGCLGLAGMTVLFPFLVFLRGARAGKPGLLGAFPDSLDVLIPVHNEEATLGATLASIRRAATLQGLTRLRLLVGLDTCNDRSAEIALAAGAEVFRFEFRSKWATLLALQAHSSAPVVAWVDAGTEWSDSLLKQVSTRWHPDLLGLAPSYRPRRAGSLHRLLWAFEAWLKTLENSAGGPVSVHGATVFYDRAALQQALARLGAGPWRNDDVLVPYVLRSLFPQRDLVYVAEIAVDDLGIDRGSDQTRRLRMAEGNLEALRFATRSTSPRAALPSLLLGRRACRVFWAWWVLLVLTALFGVWAPIFVVGTSLLLRNRPLAAAFWASFLAPILFFFPGIGRRLAWT